MSETTKKKKKMSDKYKPEAEKKEKIIYFKIIIHFISTKEKKISLYLT